MSTLWLKRIDSLSTYVPRKLLTAWPRKHGAPGAVTIIRPGGLGDLVVLTRALLQLGVSLNRVTWVVERRNSVWLDYLHVPHLSYDTFSGLVKLSQLATTNVINTEQYHGLAAVCARWLARSDCKVIGFAGHRRADLQDESVSHTPATEHELSAFTRLLNDAFTLVRFMPNGSSSSVATAPLITPLLTAEIDPDKAVIGLGGSYAEDKALTTLQWQAIVHKAQADYKTVLLLGSQRELPLSKLLTTARTASLQNLVGRIPFAETVNHLRSAGRFFGVDGGLMHIADFFEVPSSVVFPRDNVSQWRPLTPGSILWDTELRERQASN